MKHYFMKSGRGYNTAGAKLPWFAKGEDCLEEFIPAISRCQEALPKNKQKNPSQKELVLTVVVSVGVFYLRNPEGKTFASGPLGLQMSHSNREMATCSKHT